MRSSSCDEDDIGEFGFRLIRQEIGISTVTSEGAISGAAHRQPAGASTGFCRTGPKLCKSYASPCRRRGLPPPSSANGRPSRRAEIVAGVQRRGRGRHDRPGPAAQRAVRRHAPPDGQWRRTQQPNPAPCRRRARSQPTSRRLTMPRRDVERAISSRAGAHRTLRRLRFGAGHGRTSLIAAFTLPTFIASPAAMRLAHGRLERR